MMTPLRGFQPSLYHTNIFIRKFSPGHTSPIPKPSHAFVENPSKRFRLPAATRATPGECNPPKQQPIESSPTTGELATEPVRHDVSQPTFGRVLGDEHDGLVFATFHGGLGVRLEYFFRGCLFIVKNLYAASSSARAPMACGKLLLGWVDVYNNFQSLPIGRCDCPVFLGFPFFMPCAIIPGAI